MEFREDRLMRELLDAMLRNGEPGPLHTSLEAILVRIEIWTQHLDMAPIGKDKDYTEAGYNFIDAVDDLCDEPITTKKLKDGFVKACKDHTGHNVRWDYWRLRVQQDSKAAA